MGSSSRALTLKPALLWRPGRRKIEVLQCLKGFRKRRESVHSLSISAWPYVTVVVHGHVGATFRLASASRRLWRAAGGSARGRERPTGSERRADNTTARSLLGVGRSDAARTRYRCAGVFPSARAAYG